MSLSRLAPRPLSLALEGFTAAVAPASTLARVQACWGTPWGRQSPLPPPPPPSAMGC